MTVSSAGDEREGERGDERRLPANLQVAKVVAQRHLADRQQRQDERQHGREQPRCRAGSPAPTAPLRDGRCDPLDPVRSEACACMRPRKPRTHATFENTSDTLTRARRPGRQDAAQERRRAADRQAPDQGDSGMRNTGKKPMRNGNAAPCQVEEREGRQSPPAARSAPPTRIASPRISNRIWLGR